MVGMPDEREINSKDRKRVGERDRANHSQRTQRVNENSERKCVVITNDGMESENCNEYKTRSRILE